MAGANPKLNIVVAPEWRDRPEILELEKRGHSIRMGLSPGDGADLILHPAAHAWHDGLFAGPYLNAALSAARKRLRERKDA